MDITYSLTDKSPEEISIDGLISEVYRGLYVLIIQDSDYTSTATVCSDRVRYNRTYYISNYMGIILGIVAANLAIPICILNS